MGDYSSMAWSMKKLAKLLTDKIRQTNPTTTVVGSEDKIRTRFTPVNALKCIKVVFAVVDKGFMLMERPDFYGKCPKNILGKIILGTKRSQRMFGILEVKGEE